jgi:hypothetical protein
MIKLWEYNAYYFEPEHEDLEEALNKMGAAGWELVCVRGPYLIFKREKTR